jgi:predicted HAD superfamily Cof-like phosphohydrolase
MSYSFIDDVQRFHDKFGLETPPTPILLENELFKFRVGFFYEELNEYIDAVKDGDLGTAVDSLIDLIYITTGCALLHGFHPRMFNEALHASQSANVYPIMTSGEPDKDGIDFLSETNHLVFKNIATDNIEAYVQVHEARNDNYPVHLLRALTDLYLTVMYAAFDMGMTTEIFQEFWDDVHRANMSKERALRADDSKRGSTYDVIKPAGWVPPRTEELIQKYRVKGSQ